MLEHHVPSYSPLMSKDLLDKYELIMALAWECKDDEIKNELIDYAIALRKVAVYNGNLAGAVILTLGQFIKKAETVAALQK